MCGAEGWRESECRHVLNDGDCFCRKLTGGFSSNALLTVLGTTVSGVGLCS